MDRTVAVTVRRGSGVLVAANGPSAGTTVELRGGPWTVGREATSDVFLDDITVSR